MDIKICFPQGSTSTDLSQALFLASLAAFKSQVEATPPKELLFEYDTLVDIYLTRFEYSTSVETEAASFHKQIFPHIQLELVTSIDKKNSANVI